jgi:hypothetical protein
MEMDPKERRAIWQERRKKMLTEKIDYAKFLTWYYENYPESSYRVRAVNATSENDPKKAKDFWKQFR